MCGDVLIFRANIDNLYIMSIIENKQIGCIFQLSERLSHLARPEGKSSGSGHAWPLRTDLSRITQPEATRSAQAVRPSYKIRE